MSSVLLLLQVGGLCRLGTAPIYHVDNDLRERPGVIAIVNGDLTVSDEPGLGYEYDWKQLDETCLTKVEVTDLATENDVQRSVALCPSA